MKNHFYFLPLLAFYFLIIVTPLQAQTSDSQKVYITRTGEKYHTSSCRYIKQSGKAIELKEAAKSYDPCSVCKPPKVGSNSTNNEGVSIPEPDNASKKAPKVETEKKNPPVARSVQCSGTTKAGNRCKRKTTAANGRCYQH